MIRISRVRTRIIGFFVVLLVVVEAVSFVLVNAANSSNARLKIESELDVGQRVFARLLRQTAQQSIQSARVVAGDFAFREAVATHDPRTIESALQNYGERIGAGAMQFVALDHRVVADTLDLEAAPHQFDFPELLQRADLTGAAASIELMHGQGFQLVAIPVHAPLSIGWVVLGFAVDVEFARDLRQLTALEVSFFARDSAAGSGSWQSLASTLEHGGDGELRGQLASLAIPLVTKLVRINGNEQQARLIMLSNSEQVRIVAVLSRSLSSALEAFDRTRSTLTSLALASLVVSILGSIAIALNITRPLSALARAAARMESGDYSQAVEVERADEIGTLASSLNHMQESIAVREQRILTLAYQDPLTGLANRSKFSEQLAAAIKAAPPGAEAVSIMVMDLDRFKYVNDTLGHGVGDHVLRQVAARLLRAASSSECIARLGGDEFAVLLTGSAAPRVVEIAKSVVNALEQPVLYEDQPLDVGTSVGVARFPIHGDDAETLVRNADIAMYVAKRNRTGLAVYNAYYDTTQQEHLSLLGELRRAVENGELRLVYQPKVSLHSANVSAVEALIRWVHPERGTIHPAHFIPFAEHTGYIKVLTHWVLKEVVRQCGEWLGRGLKLQISANISARDLMNRDLPDQIAALLAEHCVPAGLLCLEITESGFMEDPDHARKVLDRLSNMGLRLAIDDYGVGYSSLSYIMKLPVQELKIDRSFICAIASDPDMSTIVRSTIELGHNLGMKVVAEGVEDGIGWDLLKIFGCDDAQGYFMSPPLQAVALEQWMKRHDGVDRGDTEWAMSPAERLLG